MYKTLKKAPRLEPVTLPELKQHARIDLDTDDILLTQLIKTAREYCEKATHTALIHQKWLASYDRVDIKGREIDVKHGMLHAIARVTFYDKLDQPIQLNPANYRISHHRIIFSSEFQIPNNIRDHDALEIVYTVGYGATGIDVPYPLCQAIKMLAAFWYENRESDATPFTVQSLLLPYKRFIL
jgi:uncharacterized phiE125 gp8 family phage protein